MITEDALLKDQVDETREDGLPYKTRFLNFLEILLLNITLPTWDSISDLYIAILAIWHGHPR